MFRQNALQWSKDVEEPETVQERRKRVEMFLNPCLIVTTAGAQAFILPASPLPVITVD